MRNLVNRLYKDDVQDGLQECLDAGMETSRHVQKIRSRGSGASILKCISFMKDIPLTMSFLPALAPLLGGRLAKMLIARDSPPSHRYVTMEVPAAKLSKKHISSSWFSNRGRISGSS